MQCGFLFCLFVDKADDICDENCNVDICDYDGYDCLKCDEESICTLPLDYFGSYAIIDGDYLMSQSEICYSWNIVSELLGDLFENLDLYDNYSFNCSNMIEIFDVDGNNALNAYEVGTMLSLISFATGVGETIITRYFQINCSLCAPSVEEYYNPWNWKEIDKYTNSSYWWINAYNITY